ncbi:MAG: helix-turn-helix domain-containing protein [Sphingomonadaceae bacterium]|nr:helix-turn-helix domain-containing protein [Sphingomonadaceae bacterium]
MKILAISIKRTTEVVGVGKTKVYELINKGTLKTIRIGARHLVTVASIEELIADGE